MSKKPKIAIGICSSISLYKACDLIRIFQKDGFDVHAVMTKNASRMISPLLLTALTGFRVIVDPFDEEPSEKIDHVSLAKEISLFVIAPATANMIGKIAGGVADDFLSTFYMAVECPVLVAPAMNEAMFFHPQTQENIEKLRVRGVCFVQPEKGYLACKDEGWGRLAEPERIAKEGQRLISRSHSLKGKTIMVTAGPTREYMDPVRYLSNRSSGKMGYAIAEEALHRGADVCLVSGPTHIYPPRRAQFVPIETAQEMAEKVKEHLDAADVVIMTAAVSDFMFKKESPTKLKKNGRSKTVEFSPTEDILKSLKNSKGDRIVVGFAAETENLRENAARKLRDKGLDLIVANEVGKSGIGFDSDMNEVILIKPDGKSSETGLKTKAEISVDIMNAIEDLIGTKN
ncbi:bifunctional phosphopantothenoylcysteine decarboxylase/phosphopantothenate--cysteine ligase CoaBC [Acidobacteriota bacterium]